MVDTPDNVVNLSQKAGLTHWGQRLRRISPVIVYLWQHIATNQKRFTNNRLILGQGF